MPDQQQIVDDIVSRVVFLRAVRDDARNEPHDAALHLRLEVNGEIGGLLWALCLVMGWNPGEDADKEGPADDFVQERAVEMGLLPMPAPVQAEVDRG